MGFGFSDVSATHQTPKASATHQTPKVTYSVLPKSAAASLVNPASEGGVAGVAALMAVAMAAESALAELDLVADGADGATAPIAWSMYLRPVCGAQLCIISLNNISDVLRYPHGVIVTTYVYGDLSHSTYVYGDLSHSNGKTLYDIRREEQIRSGKRPNTTEHVGSRDVGSRDDTSRGKGCARSLLDPRCHGKAECRAKIRVSSQGGPERNIVPGNTVLEGMQAYLAHRARSTVSAGLPGTRSQTN